MSILERARQALSAGPVLTNHGLTRTELRWLERHGYVRSVMVKYPERRVIAKSPHLVGPKSAQVVEVGHSIRRQWGATARLMEMEG